MHLMLFTNIGSGCMNQGARAERIDGVKVVDKFYIEE